jgi:hypothetical protein
MPRDGWLTRAIENVRRAERELPDWAWKNPQAPQAQRPVREPGQPGRPESTDRRPPRRPQR